MIDWNRWHLYQEALKPWQWGLVVLGIFAATWLIILIRAYFREDADDAEETLEMLTQFRDLHRQGGLSDDEFRLIRSRLARNAREALVAGEEKTSAILAESGQLNSLGSPQDKKNESIAITATEKETSVGMTDEETE